jgi:ribonuclease BN (tRNA processing enzyme)
MPGNRREFIRKSVLLSGAIGFNASYPPDTKTGESINQATDRLVLLGTQGGPFIRSYKQTPSASLIAYKGIHFVIDAGFGVTFKLRDAGINLSTLKYIFITHHHSDHNLELGPLLYNAWIAGLSAPIHVYGPKGLNSFLNYYWKSNQFDIEIRIKDEERPDIRKLVISHEYSEGLLLSSADFEISALRNIHPPIHDSFAIRFNLGEKIIVFSGDTAYCPSLTNFAGNADYLVHEVMYIPGVDEMIKKRPNNAVRLKASILSHHTSAEDVGKIAAAARVKNLVLNHFVPPDENMVSDHVWLDAVRSNFQGNIVIGKDLLQIAI